jgi:hypothetical protein
LKRKPIESPCCIATCRPSAFSSAPAGEVTGSGAESTTVRPTPASSTGRRTAIRGASVPAIRLARTLAETKTPSAGVSTVALRRANWR